MIPKPRRGDPMPAQGKAQRAPPSCAAALGSFRITFLGRAVRVVYRENIAEAESVRAHIGLGWYARGKHGGHYAKQLANRIGVREQDFGRKDTRRGESPVETWDIAPGRRFPA